MEQIYLQKINQIQQFVSWDKQFKIFLGCAKSDSCTRHTLRRFKTVYLTPSNAVFAVSWSSRENVQSEVQRQSSESQWCQSLSCIYSHTEFSGPFTLPGPDTKCQMLKDTRKCEWAFGTQTHCTCLLFNFLHQRKFTPTPMWKCEHPPTNVNTAAHQRRLVTCITLKWEMGNTFGKGLCRCPQWQITAANAPSVNCTELCTQHLSQWPRNTSAKPRNPQLPDISPKRRIQM